MAFIQILNDKEDIKWQAQDNSMWLEYVLSRKV